MIQSLLACVLLPAAAATDSGGPARRKTVRGHLKGLETRDGVEGEVIGVGEDAASITPFLFVCELEPHVEGGKTGACSR